MDYTGVTLMKSYEYIKKSVKDMLDDKRYKHSKGVEAEAVKLAKTYNENIEKCRIAGIAHDCVKEMSDDELIKKAGKYNIDIDEIQLHSPQLLHGPVGAEYIRRNFDVTDMDILNAVYYHTTGRPNASMIEKIIYLADVIEESRNFEGIESIRDAAYKDIDRAIILSCNSTFIYIIKNNYLIHPLTLDFRNSLILKGGKQNGEI